MQRLVALGQTHLGDQFEYGLKPINHPKKIDTFKVENKQQLSNMTKDRQALSIIIKEEIKSLISAHMHGLEEDLKSIRNIVQSERKNGQHLTQQFSLLKSALSKSLQNTYKPSISPPLTRSPSVQSNSSSDIKILHLETQISSLSSRVQELNKISRLLEPQKQSQNMLRQISTLKNQLHLQIAQTRDGILDIQQAFKLRFQKLEVANFNLNNSFQYGIDELSNKYMSVHHQIQNNSIEIEKHSTDLYNNMHKIQLLQKNIKETDNIFLQKMMESKSSFQTKLVQIEEIFQASLEKVIVPYNSNFQEIDRNIYELKDVVKDVLKFTKALGDKLATKLNNTIDAATFQKTIESLNQSFSQTYLLNTQKIKELNQKQYEVYNQLNQVKDVLQNLKVEYKSANKLNQDGRNPFQKKITSLGDLGIDSDYDDLELKSQETQQPEMPNPFKRRTQRQLQKYFD